MQLADSIIRQPTVLAACALALAMAFGVLLAMIVAEIRKAKDVTPARAAPAKGATAAPTHSPEEMERRRSLVRQLMDLYSGVHSVEALSRFLNDELERRHERWRVRIPADGPGEFYDLDL